MLIATWNVNSIRTRLTQIIDWINQVNPDILCLQETKVIDDDFPVEPFEKLGYSLEIYGQKSLKILVWKGFYKNNFSFYLISKFFKFENSC